MKKRGHKKEDIKEQIQRNIGSLNSSFFFHPSSLILHPFH
jgi:hypothetical protein